MWWVVKDSGFLVFNKIIDAVHFEGMYWFHFKGPRTLILGDEGSTFLQ